LDIDKVRLVLLERRKQKGLSAKKLGELVGVDKTTIYRYEKGQIDKMPLTVANKLASALDINPAFIAGFSKTPYSDTLTTLSQITDTSAKLKETRKKIVLTTAEQQLEEQKQNELISFEEKRREKEQFSQNRGAENKGALGAGVGVNNFYGDIHNIEDHEWPIISIPDDAPYDFDWVYTASGDSMKPKYEDGDIVYAKGLDDYDRSNLSTDDIYVVRVGEDSFLKKIRISEDGLYLVSLNKKYEDIRVCENEYVKVVAKVVD